VKIEVVKWVENKKIGTEETKVEKNGALITGKSANVRNAKRKIDEITESNKDNEIKKTKSDY
jgi:ethanolamine utilization protein EutA (predicted chaperonin)